MLVAADDALPADRGRRGAASAWGARRSCSYAEARRELGRRRTAIDLPVAVNADSLATWFRDVLADVAGWDGVALRLRVEDQAYSAGLLRSGDALAAVTSEPSPVQGCAVEPLGVLRYRPAATPAFAERWRRGRGMDWERMPVVVFNEKDELQHDVLPRAASPAADRAPGADVGRLPRGGPPRPRLGHAARAAAAADEGRRATGATRRRTPALARWRIDSPRSTDESTVRGTALAALVSLRLPVVVSTLRFTEPPSSRPPAVQPTVGVALVTIRPIPGRQPIPQQDANTDPMGSCETSVRPVRRRRRRPDGSASVGAQPSEGGLVEVHQRRGRCASAIARSALIFGRCLREELRRGDLALVEAPCPCRRRRRPASPARPRPGAAAARRRRRRRAPSAGGWC